MSSDPSAGSILVVEDDRKTAALLATYLEKDGFEVLSAPDGEAALRLVEERRPRLVLLDIVMPGIDGWQVCRRIRERSDLPIIIVTSREEEMDRILGLSLGADDYVVKPFSPREVVARVRAVLRRTDVTDRPSSAALRLGRIELDLDRRRVELDGRPVAMTKAEFLLLETLMRAPGKVFTRDELLDVLYPDGNVVVDRVVDVHIGKIRQKIEVDPANPHLVRTVRGFGYQFSEEEGADTGDAPRSSN